MRISAPTARLMRTAPARRPRSRARSQQRRRARRAGRARGRPRPGRARRRGRSRTRVPPPISGATSAAAPGSSPASGSSSSSSSGSCSTARQTAVRWTIPRENVCTGSSARARSPTASSSSSIARERARRAAARGSAGSRARSGRGRAAARGRGSRRCPRTAQPSRGSSWPSTRATPRCGRSSVARIRSSVVLPAPLAPKTASVSPSSSASVTPASATRSPYARPTSASSIALMVRRVPAEGAHHVLERRREHREELVDRLRRAREVDDQRLAGDARTRRG